MRAAHQGHLECLELLLAQDGVDVNKTDKVRVWMGGGRRVRVEGR